MPAKAEEAVAGARVVGEGKLGAKARATGRGEDRHAYRTGASHRTGTEFFSDPADRPATLGKGN